MIRLVKNMKLVADINSIMSNLATLASSIEEYSSAVNEFNGASINCSLEEVSGLIEDYKSSISEDLNKLNTSSEEYKALVDDCCTEYQANEANVQEIDVSKIDDVIMNNKEVTIDYQGDASSALTPIILAPLSTAHSTASHVILRISSFVFFPRYLP